jgi:ABC-type antimicrobial peptide transport system permease subunit
MFKNYFRTAFRNLVRNRLFTVLNILGLSTSLACTMLILLWVVNEMSYDRFNKNLNHTYRVTATTIGQSYPLAGAPLADAIKAQIPGIKYTARMKANYGSSSIFTVGERHFEEKRSFYADAGFLQVFSYPLVSGDPKTALVKPDGLLITERTAKKYFGTSNAIGRTVRTNDSMVFTVTGILKDIPANSHLQFDMLLPMSYDARIDEDIIHSHWDNLNFYTYIVLDDHTAASPSVLAAMERRIREINKKGEPTFDAVFQLQPLSRVHLYSKSLAYDIDGQGDIGYVRIFSIVAIFILLVACINFMNLATARSARRAKEVGIRKIIGARRGQLIGQFLSESLLITFVALALGLVFVAAALPAFNQVVGKQLSIDLSNGWLFAGLLSVFLLTSLVSGSYPAFFLSSFRPIKVLKVKVVRAGAGSHFFRNGLVVFQFVVSIVLIVGTTVVYRQLHFIRDRDLGYDKANLLYIPLKGELPHKTGALAAAFRNSASLHNYSIISELPVNAGMGTIGVRWKGITQNQVMFSVMGADEHFLSLFKMRLVSGRCFSTDFAADTLNYIVNEKALGVMGMDVNTAVGQSLTLWGNKGTIVGVVKDFNFKPVQRSIDPLILRYNPGAGKEWLRRTAVVSVPPTRVAGAIDELKGVWAQLNPAYDFEYGFVDQQLERLYLSEQRMGLLFNTFALLAIFISCLGLCGLAAFTAEQRTKEIGIRKVLGADVAGIVAMLSKGFVRLVLIATLIASPLAWYIMQRWLQDFAYRITISGWVFAGAGMAALLIALFTVSFQAIRAAVANPVKSLRAE